MKNKKKLGYLNENKLDLMQEKADQFALSHDIGKIPRKISSRFDGLDLDKYKIWILLFHTYVLDDVISKRDKDCFGKFVLA